ncbi:MAG: hypothetical protein L6R35_004003 [Caloplaca aegaea]|nr:MAG: hypothetical protein L6R35_004003 [Caloplaca aegaea]
MLCNSVSAFAASFALLSALRPAICFAAAAPAGQQNVERPRYYFPRQVNRIVTNSSVPSVPETTETTVEPTTTTTPLDALVTSLATTTSRLPDGSETTQVLTIVRPSEEVIGDEQDGDPTASVPSSTPPSPPSTTPTTSTTPVTTSTSGPPPTSSVLEDIIPATTNDGDGGTPFQSAQNNLPFGNIGASITSQLSDTLDSPVLPLDENDATTSTANRSSISDEIDTAEDDTSTAESGAQTTSNVVAQTNGEATNTATVASTTAPETAPTTTAAAPQTTVAAPQTTVPTSSINEPSSTGAATTTTPPQTTSTSSRGSNFLDSIFSGVDAVLGAAPIGPVSILNPSRTVNTSSTTAENINGPLSTSAGATVSASIAGSNIIDSIVSSLGIFPLGTVPTVPVPTGSGNEAGTTAGTVDTAVNTLAEGSGAEPSATVNTPVTNSDGGSATAASGTVDTPSTTSAGGSGTAASSTVSSGTSGEDTTATSTTQDEGAGSTNPVISVGASVSIELPIPSAITGDDNPTNGQQGPVENTAGTSNTDTDTGAPSQTSPIGGTGQQESTGVPTAQSTDIEEDNSETTNATTPGQDSPVVLPVVSLPITVSNDQITFTDNVPLTLSRDGTSGLPSVVSVPVTLSNDQTTFISDVGVSVPTAAIVDAQDTTAVRASNDQPTSSNAGEVPGPTTMPDDGAQVTTSPEPLIVVPVTVSNDQITLITNVPVEIPSSTIVPLGTEPISVAEPSIVVPVTVSNDQTTFITNVPVEIPSSTIVPPGTEPISVPVTISNDQATLTTDVPIADAVTLPSLSTAINLPLNSGGESTKTAPQSVASTGTGIPVVPVTDPAFSTAITLSDGTVATNTAETAVSSGATGSGDVTPLIISPTTRPTGEGATLSVTGETSITGSVPTNPVSSGAIVFGPSGEITLGSQTSGTATSTGTDVPVQSASDGSTQTAGVTFPSASGSGIVASPPVSEPSGTSQTIGTGGVVSTGQAQAPTGATGATDATQGASASTAGASASTVIQTGTGVVTSAGETAVSDGPSPTSAPVIPQYTNTREPVSITYNDANGEAPQTIQPVGSDTSTAIPLATSLVLAPPAPQPTVTSEFIPVVLPSSVPPLIQPPGGMPAQPEDTMRVQVGFLQPLNYGFVVNSEVTQGQIFDFLPKGIAFGLNISEAQVTMETLKADVTTTDLPYIRTLALAFIPKDQVNQLYLNLHTAPHHIYHNPNASIAQLMSFIDPSVAIQAENPMAGSSGPGAGGSASPTPTNPVTGGAPIGGAISNSMPVRKSSVAIGVGVVCGAAAYGAAMFFIARRYKMRRQSHGRSPSMYNSPVYSGSHRDFVGGANAALMSGARGDGGRSTSPMDGYGYGYGRDSRGSGRSGSTGRQQISAPVMAENSLGWN